MQEGPDQDRARAEINAAVTELVGAPPDEVLLAPPGAVLKTSSGKVRRAVIRQLYERGLLGKPRHRIARALARASVGSVTERWRKMRIRVGEWLFAALALSVFIGLAPIVWGAIMTLPTLEARWRVMRWGIRSLRRITRTPLLVDGLAHLPPPGVPFILVSNHASYLDAYVLIDAIPRTMGFVAKAELGRDKLLGKALARIGTEFVERFEAEKSLSDAKRLVSCLEGGKSLLYFAEGTFTRIPGLRPFRMGAFTAAVEAGVAVLPVALRGTRSILRGEEAFPHRGAITLTLGEPISAAAIRAETADNWQAALHLRDRVRAHILRYCGEPELS
jgi:1-acyl-sn-glycerol-3-phosphate acyltransferase